MTFKKLNLIVICVVAGLTGLFVGALLLPGTKELNLRLDEAAQKMQEVRAAQEEVGDVGELYATIVELDKRMADYRQHLPMERQFGEFLRSLSENLRTAGIDQNVVQQRAEQRLDETKLPASLKPALGTGILPVQISFESSFSQLFDFLKSVESLPRLSHVESLQLTNDEHSPGRVRAEIVLHTYYHPPRGRMDAVVQ